MNYAELLNAQRSFFSTKATLPYAFRLAQLKKLRNLVAEHEQEILEALHKDLHKSAFEGWGAEVGIILTEADYFIRHLKKWMRSKPLRTPIFHFRAQSYIQSIPHGNTLIIAPWNYPFLLSLRPLLGAIAAGNTAIIKPSEHAAHTAGVIEKMINQHFDPAYLHVVNTDALGSSKLLEQEYSFIFYTGGSTVGRIVYQAAARNLTPVVLEMGGKNPCIIEPSADLEVTATRITWGKFSNAGQTCVAPDYLLVHASMRDALIEKIISKIESFFQNDLIASQDYGRIINDQHVARIQRLLQEQKVIYGGTIKPELRFIAPTLVEVTDMQSPIMQEEIFGPVLPIISYTHPDEVWRILEMNPDPLVLYLFTTDQHSVYQFAQEASSGDMVVNEVVLHFGHLHMPIGGKGASGIGKYQGKYSYDVFSHPKSVMHRKFYPDLSIRYPPYDRSRVNTLKKLFRHFFD